jgi:hypothetical protein
MATNNAANMYVTVGPTRQILLPAQPAFFAWWQGNTVTNATGDGTLYTCSFDTIDLNIGSCFAANTFTAPISGNYLLTATATITSIGAGHTESILYLTTTARTYQSVMNAATACSASGSLGLKYSAVIPMSAGDTAIVQLKVSNSTKTIGYYGVGSGYVLSSFSGALIS